MRFVHEGMSLWFESDPSVTAGVAPAGADIILTVGVEPADASNRVEVRYRINGGPTARVPADAVRHTGMAQYFSAHVPTGTLRAGDAVEYTAVCRCAGRQVPSREESERFGASFRVVGVKPESEGGVAQKKVSLMRPIASASRATAALATFPIQINATQLFYREFFLFIQGETQTPTFSTKTVQELPLAPGSYAFQFGSGMIADFNFTVTADGNVDYAPEFNKFLSGGGGTSNKLTLSGLPVTLDARLLTGANSAVRPSGFFLANAQLTPIIPEDWIVFQTIRLLPAKGCGVNVGDGLPASFGFDLNRDGTFDYNPAWDSSNGGFLKGKGSDTLTFLGYPLTLNATAVSTGLSVNVANFPPSTTGKLDAVLLPAKGYALNLTDAPSNISFNLELDGKLTFNAPLSNSLTLENEAGRPMLRVLDAPANQLAFPFVGAGDTKDPLFSLSNAGTGQVVFANSSQGTGVEGVSKTGVGVQGKRDDFAFGNLGCKDPQFGQNAGVYGESFQQGVMGLTSDPRGTGVYGGGTGTAAGKQIGVRGETVTGVGVQGQSFGTGLAGKFIGDVEVAGTFTGDIKVEGQISANTVRIKTGEPNAVEAVVEDPRAAHSPHPPPLPQHNGLYASTTYHDGSGVLASGGKAGLEGHSSRTGVLGESTEGTGVVGNSDRGDGMGARTGSSAKSGIFAHNDDTKPAPKDTAGGNGVFGLSTVPNASGVFGANNNGGIGVAGNSDNGIGIHGRGRIAGRFEGDVEVTGDIRLTTGQDCAEDFDVARAEGIEPGTVMVIKEDGALKQSDHEYDKKVAGVVSGAGDYKPAIVLGRHEAQQNRVPVALVGKVYCKVDARFSPIEVGDLLTTSSTPGHAMKADDPLRALGTLIGKALRPLKQGLGLIPILVALQ